MKKRRKGYGSGLDRCGILQNQVYINERASCYYLMAHVSFKTAQAESESLIIPLTPFATYVDTLTTIAGSSQR